MDTKYNRLMRQLVWMLLLFCCAVSAHLPVKVQSKAAILINADSGAVLFEKNKDKQAFPASITKIATALYALRHTSAMDQVVMCPSECLVKISPKVKVDHGFTHPSHWLEYDGTTYGIRKGELLPLGSLFHGMMLVSGNDAANVIAHHVSGNVLNFVEDMNEYLRAIGCESTQFRNPHGLHHPEHYTTAHDMARITQEALKDPHFRAIVSALEHERPKTNKQPSRVIVQANRLLKKVTKFYYSKALGIKTGYHSRAGYTLVAAAEHDGRTLIAVILGSPDATQRYRDAINLFDAAFAEKQQRRLLFKQDENTFRYEIDGAKCALLAAIDQDLYLNYYPAEEPELCSHLEWDVPKLPIEPGAQVGALVVTDGLGCERVRAPLLSTEQVAWKWWWPLWHDLRIRYGGLLLLFAIGSISLIHFAPNFRKIGKR